MLTGNNIVISKLLTGLYMSACKGGRGLKAPYETTHVRVPVPIKEKVQKIIDDYKNDIADAEGAILEYEEAVELANKILKSKKGASISLSKLLTGIYRKETTL
jgi:hypothetical protein